METFIFILSLIAHFCIGWAAVDITKALHPKDGGVFSFSTIWVFVVVVGLAAGQTLFS